MRSKLIALLIGCGLAAIVAPALAHCGYNHTASSTSDQTAQSQPASDTDSN